jgi:hypothetical protein
VCVSVTEQQDGMCIDTSRFSNFFRLLRAVGWMLRFISNCQKGKRRGELSPEELKVARLKLLLSLQKQEFKQELEDLKAQRSLKHSKIANLNPFIAEDGLLRAGSRLQFAVLEYNEKFPVILPKCHVSQIYIRSCHLTSHHAGVNLLIVSIRAEY